jgi:electron transfer flavoprotein beta subunit
LKLTVEATAVREIEGGKETISVKLPAVIAGQKGLVEEKDLIIPNMRGIMSARTKPLQLLNLLLQKLKLKLFLLTVFHQELL